MPTSMVRRFAEPDEYVACMQATSAEVSITRSGYFAAKLARISLHSNRGKTPGSAADQAGRIFALT